MPGGIPRSTRREVKRPGGCSGCFPNHVKPHASKLRDVWGKRAGSGIETTFWKELSSPSPGLRERPHVSLENCHVCRESILN